MIDPSSFKTKFKANIKEAQMFLSKVFIRKYAKCTSGIKIALLGAAGNVGIPLSLIYKQSKLFDEILLYDKKDVSGIVADLNHIDTTCSVKGTCVKQDLGKNLKGADIVVLLAGNSRKKDMTRDDLFKNNATVVKELGEEIAKYCPTAFIILVTNPINSMVPLFSEVMKNCDALNPKKIFGFTSLSTVRAKIFIAELTGCSVNHVTIPIIGGHSEDTTVPILSKCIPSMANLQRSEIIELTERIQRGADEVVRIKGQGPTLSAVHALFSFTDSICQAINEKEIVQTAYVASKATSADYFSNLLIIGPEGIKENLGVGKLSHFEEEIVSKAIENLKQQIQKAKNFLLEI